MEYLGENLPEPCGNCDSCRHPADLFDGTIAAQKALSCVFRTGQRFGAVHIVDVLLGADTERVRQFGHNKLPTYGVGKEFSRDQWRDILRQLVTHGLLVIDMEGHGGLRLASDATCRPVLRGEQKVSLRQTAKGKTENSLRDEVRSKKRPASAALEGDEDEQLFKALRDLRLSLAKAQNVPPYVIFHDTTLVALVKLRPQSLHDFGRVPGVGAAKLERYGEVFMKVIAQ